MRIGFILSLIFAVLVALFGIQNAAVISVNFFSAKFDISLALVIFLSAIVGAIVVTLMGLQKEFSLMRGNKRLTKDAKHFEADIEASKTEILALKIENEGYKTNTQALDTKINDLQTKAEDLATKLASLESKNDILHDEINTLNIENSRLTTMAESETTSSE